MQRVTKSCLTAERAGSHSAHADAGCAQGTVTNVTDVKPLLTVATYLDQKEATEAYQEVAGAQPSFATSPGHAPDRSLATAASRYTSIQCL